MDRTRWIVAVGVLLVGLSSGAAYFGAQMAVSSNDDGDTGNQVIEPTGSPESTNPVTTSGRQTRTDLGRTAPSTGQADLSSSNA